MNRSRLVSAAVAVALLGAVMVVGSPASATFPGDLGSIFAVGSSSLGEGSQGLEQWASTTDYEGQVNECAEGRAISVAPNGQSIAYACVDEGDSEIFLRHLPSGVETQLTTNLVDDYDPGFSPDGQSIVYSTLDPDANRRLAILDLETGESDYISAAGGEWEEWGPVWNPADPTEIAYVSDFFGGDPDIVIRDLEDDSGFPEALTDNTLDDFGPNYSSSGNRLLYSSEDLGSGTQQIHIYNFNSGTDTQVTTDLTTSSFEPALSPNGDVIVFSNQALTVGAEIRLYAIPVEGGTPQILPNQEQGTNYNHAEWQAFGSGSTCPPDCPPPVDRRSVSLKLSGSLKASGRVTDEADDPRCTRDQRVIIERKRGDNWNKVGQTRTGNAGRYEVKIDDKSGRYRAKVERRTIQNDVDVTCSRAVSKVRRN